MASPRIEQRRQAQGDSDHRSQSEGATPRTLTLTRDPDDVHDTAIVRGFGMDTSEIQENLPLRDEARVGWIDSMVSPQGSVAMDIKIFAADLKFR